ncbi:glutathione ABC transporter substrate-binding protein [Jeotgalibacillus aurantiacus]|uniref:glutathione ABC transporter substrate-binding protein n=1 Tax=Jeotgalibacillus aurantiacus TaxID=2763266 RepID=UPI0029CAB438|nr:glutathione ABC transporter substrate-binding protein [Jeotgalibacillus aurantiacus]
MTSKKTLWAFLLTLVLAMFLAACAGGSEDEGGGADEGGGSDEGTGEEAAAGGDLMLNVLSDVSSLDPHGSNDVPSSNVQANIYETLIFQDENNELQPMLAESWEPVDDLTWEFKLREGVKFHDGSDFTAEVVKANLDRVLDPAVASPRGFLYEMITEVTVVDDYTVQITTEYPFAPLLAHLTHSGGAMISLDAIEADYAAMEEGSEPGSVIAQNPVGTGFMQFDSWTPGEEVVLTKFDEYWGEPAGIDSATFRVVPESATRLAELETGNAHIIDPVQPNEVSRVDNLDGASMNIQSSTSLAYLGFNMDKEPFNDVRVRQAISMAIDKQSIIEGIYEGYGIEAIGPIPPGVFGFNESVEPLQYDMDQARALLEEAGLADGFETSIWTNDNPQREAIAILVQEALAELNITVDIQILEFGAFLEQTAAGQHDMFILGWSTPTGDADYATYALFHSSQVGDPGNRSFLRDDEVDQLLEAGRQETDQDARADIYLQLQERLVELAPMAYINHTEYLTGVSDNVQGFSILPNGLYQLKDVTISE